MHDNSNAERLDVKGNDLLSGLDLRTILDLVPAAIFILDVDTRILGMNINAIKLTGKELDQFDQQLCGNVLQCIHALEAPAGCGTNESCPDCVIRNTIAECCSGKNVVGRRADILLKRNNGIYKGIFSISASSFQNNGTTLCLLSMEDVSEIVLLRNLVPICCKCKSVRTDKAYWESIEKYLHDNFGTLVSHGICPKCAKEYYPDFDIYED